MEVDERQPFECGVADECGVIDEKCSSGRVSYNSNAGSK
jgi:hypothetical protein